MGTRLWIRTVIQLGVTALMLAGASRANADPGDRVTVGAGVVSFPSFQGADDLRILPTPLVDI
jgi:hypothetical protein